MHFFLVKNENDLINQCIPSSGGNKAFARILKLGLSVMIIGIAIFSVLCGLSFAASTTSVKIESIQVNPGKTEPGKYPDVIANIRTEGRQAEEVNVIAALTRPDHLVKSWHWKKFILNPGKTASVTLPKEYDTKLTGVYKIEFVIYSADMRRRLYADSRFFVIDYANAPTTITPEAPQFTQRKREERKTRRSEERSHFGIGAYGNTLNPSGGVTVMLWPFRNVGIQGIYTVGGFTSYEARLLFKMETSSGFNPYAGVGYLSVSKKADVIGVSTEFKDSTVSGVLGVEIPMGKRIRGYIEVSGRSIDLQTNVTNNETGLSAHATAQYIPVTVGVGVVFSLF